ncbi:GNAT family N-acetyltransferase [Methylobacter luteus]|uniref:GNAT family N-acetyltransferase n=1 Tax=Methylobacter luteus TaxID=415 RepID=UPI000411B5BC|nr:GNAT family N-acetyltransferase [Methylobacter luteus]
MSKPVKYRLDRASEAEIAEHLLSCDADFVPPLSGRVEITDYAKKIAGKAARFEAWSGDKLVGLVAVYCNDPKKRIAYITSVSVLRESTGKGIAKSLMRQCIARIKALGMHQVRLEVASGNMPAIGLYEKSGFVAGKTKAPFVTMDLYLK